MSITHTITKTWQGSAGIPLAKSVSLTGAEEINFDFSLPGSSSHVVYPLAFTKSLLQSIYIVSDQNISIHFYGTGTGTAENVINLTAGDPFQWDINCGIPNPFAGNVFEIALYNAGATAANVSIRTLTNG